MPFHGALAVGPFTRLRVEDIAFRELEIRIEGKGGKKCDVPIFQSLARELKLYLGERRSGYVFPSPRGGNFRLHAAVYLYAENQIKRIYRMREVGR